MKLIFVACQIIFYGTEGNFKKSRYLLFQENPSALEFNTFQPDAFLDFGDSEGVVKDILPINRRNGQIFCHGSAPLYRFKENLVVLFLLHIVGVEGLHGIGFELVVAVEG